MDELLTYETPRTYKFEDIHGSVIEASEDLLLTIINIRKGNITPALKAHLKPQRQLTPLWPVDFEAVEALRRAEQQIKENQ